MDRELIGEVGQVLVERLTEKMREAIAGFPASVEEREAIRDAVAHDLGRASVDA